jgi:hypothetical protein
MGKLPGTKLGAEFFMQSAVYTLYYPHTSHAKGPAMQNLLFRHVPVFSMG